jgi:cell division protein DivIC
MLKYFKNIYVFIFAVFLIWMLFIDTNSFLMHSDLNESIDKLEDEKAYYKKEIITDKKALKKLNTKDGLEKFARESYYMKRENEDIYIIEYQDSLKLKKDD